MQILTVPSAKILIFKVWQLLLDIIRDWSSITRHEYSRNTLLQYVSSIPWDRLAQTQPKQASKLPVSNIIKHKSTELMLGMILLIHSFFKVFFYKFNTLLHMKSG